MSLHRFPFRLLFLSAATFLSLCPATIFADDDTGPDPGSSTHGVARLSIVTGDVSVRRGDSGDYVAAAINAPLVASDAIAIGPSGRAVGIDLTPEMIRTAREAARRARVTNATFQVGLAEKIPFANGKYKGNEYTKPILKKTDM